MTDLLPTNCPYCGERVELVVDRAGGIRQTYVEDCPVCCNPWQVRAHCDAIGDWIVELQRLDD